MCTSPSPPFSRGVEPPTKFSKRGGGALTGPQLLEGVAGKEGDDFFQGAGGGGGCNFYIKNKLKFEISND